MELLKKVTVLDCTTLLPGPFCTMMLAELGATVVKVERIPLGDPMRELMQECFGYLNGNKKLITLDVKKSKGRELFITLAKKADVVVEGFRPGVTKRLGIDFDSIKAVNPTVIYCSLSGYGQTGPYVHLPGHDINYMGLVGQLSLCGDPASGRPEYPGGFQVADISGTMFALTSILAALLRPKDASSAIYLDVSLAESLAMWMMPRFLEYLGQSRPPKAQFMGRGPYGIFETRDGKYITLGVVENHFWENLCRAVGIEDLLEDESLTDWVSRNRQRDKIVPRLKAAIKDNDLEFWLKKLTQADVPVAPVWDFDTWANDPQLKDRNFISTNKDGTVDRNSLTRYPVSCLVERSNKSTKEPLLGRDTSSILQELGLTRKDIHLLREANVI